MGTVAGATGSGGDSAAVGVMERGLGLGNDGG